MKLRVILSLIVVLFIGQSMCAMSTQILRRPIVLDGEIIEEGNRSINPLIPISADIDGTIVAEVKQGRDGASIKLGDRMKALQWLSDHMDLATEEQRTKIAHMKAQTDKITGNNQEIEDMDEIESDIYGG